jgi:hypothetical protein
LIGFEVEANIGSGDLSGIGFTPKVKCLLRSLTHTEEIRSGFAQKGRVERIALLRVSFSDTEFHGVEIDRSLNPKLSPVSIHFRAIRFLTKTGAWD